jgi:hypothetical protein
MSYEVPKFCVVSRSIRTGLNIICVLCFDISMSLSNKLTSQQMFKFQTAVLAYSKQM